MSRPTRGKERGERGERGGRRESRKGRRKEEGGRRKEEEREKEGRQQWLSKKYVEGRVIKKKWRKQGGRSGEREVSLFIHVHKHY